jgi:hypothetical protein
VERPCQTSALGFPVRSAIRRSHQYSGPSLFLSLSARQWRQTPFFSSAASPYLVEARTLTKAEGESPEDLQLILLALGQGLSPPTATASSQAASAARKTASGATTRGRRGLTTGVHSTAIQRVRCKRDGCCERAPPVVFAYARDEGLSSGLGA